MPRWTRLCARICGPWPRVFGTSWAHREGAGTGGPALAYRSSVRPGCVAQHGDSPCAYRRRTVRTRWWPVLRHPLSCRQKGTSGLWLVTDERLCCVLLARALALPSTQLRTRGGHMPRETCTKKFHCRPHSTRKHRREKHLNCGVPVMCNAWCETPCPCVTSVTYFHTSRCGMAKREAGLHLDRSGRHGVRILQL